MSQKQLSVIIGVVAISLGMIGLRLPVTDTTTKLQVGADPPRLVSSPFYQTGHEDIAGNIQETLARTTSQPAVSNASGAIISHHLPTALPAINQVYKALAQRTKPVKRVIVLGPDHRDLATWPIVTTKGNYQTPFGIVKPDIVAIEQLLANKTVSLEEIPFQDEHSIGVQAILSSLVFPQAKIVPIIIHSSTTVDEAQVLGERLGSLIDDETVVIASVDFSHYYPEKQARALDAESAQRLAENTLASVRNVRSDSTQALIALQSAMASLGAIDFVLLSVTNSSEWSNDRDFTTGYVSAVYQQPGA